MVEQGKEAFVPKVDAGAVEGEAALTDDQLDAVTGGSAGLCGGSSGIQANGLSSTPSNSLGQPGSFIGSSPNVLV